ncbi:hydroxyethylthiazole kinase [Gryllotalpicola koreensis]|uniref:Hydroxyethylthiazole kinase n=2 Tax=Gryllotalpicola koreensis TaxID=993086 RepID=A0ABP8A588_9MICO
MLRTPENLIESTCADLASVRAQMPLVQCIINRVVAGHTANVLLALGASAAMVDIPGEAGMFADMASGLLVNLGTPTAEQREAMFEAVDGASKSGTPWVLDPVAVGSLPVRTPLASRLRALAPAIVRGNASEIVALADAGPGGRGVDSSLVVEAAVPSARSLAESIGAVVAVSGPEDLVVDRRGSARIRNGHPSLTQITGGGCALGAVMAAFAAIDDNPFAATVAATTVYTVAAELAAQRASGPGTFLAAHLDALATVTADDIRERAAIRV